MSWEKVTRRAHITRLEITIATLLHNTSFKPNAVKGPTADIASSVSGETMLLPTLYAIFVGCKLRVVTALHVVCPISGLWSLSVWCEIG
jgi:hypothetical protein